MHGKTARETFGNSRPKKKKNKQKNNRWRLTNFKTLNPCS